MGFIDINIEESKRRATDISNASNSIKRISKELEDTREAVSGVWSGDGSQRYRQKLNKISCRVRMRGDNLTRISAGLQASAERIERIESYIKNLYR